MTANQFSWPASVEDLPALGSGRYRHACTFYQESVLVAGGYSSFGSVVESLSLRYVRTMY
jgi:hypothetical protein